MSDAPRTRAGARWRIRLTFTEPGALMSFRHTEFEALVRNPNRDRLWFVSYMDLGSKHGSNLKKGKIK